MTAPDTTHPTPTAPPTVGFAAPLCAVDTVSVEKADDTLRVVAQTRIRTDEPSLAGHFPDFPVFPGVFVLEALCQAIASVLGESVRLRTITSVRFMAPLLPEDTLRLDILVTPKDEGWLVDAQGFRMDETVAASVRARFVDGVDDDD